MLARCRRLLKKSIAAMVAAIEIYNKPDYKYREETFAILALNAWELLLKAYVLQRSGNRLSSIYVYEKRSKPDGTATKKRYIKRNRSDNPMTIGLVRAMKLIESKGWHAFDPAVVANLDGMIEVRDNAVHYTNEHLAFAKAIQELGTASIQNYVRLAKAWFSEDLSEYNFYLMPLAFFRDFKTVGVVELCREEQRVVELLLGLHQRYHSVEDDGFSVLMEMDVRLKRTASTSAVRLAVGDEGALTVTLTEEDIRERYPWDYAELSGRLWKRYSDFKQNQEYHELRKPLKGDPTYVRERYLDPGNPRSAKKEFYSPNVLNVFDRHYTRR